MVLILLLTSLSISRPAGPIGTWGADLITLGAGGAVDSARSRRSTARARSGRSLLISAVAIALMTLASLGLAADLRMLLTRSSTSLLNSHTPFSILLGENSGCASRISAAAFSRSSRFGQVTSGGSHFCHSVLYHLVKYLICI